MREEEAHNYIIAVMCIAHYIANVVAEEERKEGNLDPTNYTCKIQTNMTLGHS